MVLRIDHTLTDGVTRLSGDEQESVKIKAFVVRRNE